MVTLPDDVAVVKEYLTELASELQLPSLPKLGAMIETPAPALSAREIAKHLDFLSFGTNDLTAIFTALLDKSFRPFPRSTSRRSRRFGIRAVFPR
jgi:phosphoenolpyruvate-protein kinase (PTS system EI component)